MRSRCAVYVDAGYLIASAATRVTGTSLRSGVYVKHARLVTSIIEQAEEHSGLPLLRVNWYDSGAGREGTADPIQRQIGLLPRVKLRLGRLSPAGDQKGVDLRIGLDLVMHARNGAVDVMYLVSGDDDLTEAVEEVQSHGIPVILLVVPGLNEHPHGVSQYLQREADDLVVIASSAIDNSVIEAPPKVVATEAAVEEVPEPQDPVPVGMVPAEEHALRPSPSMLATRRVPRPDGVSIPAPVRPVRKADVVYSSTTGQDSGRSLGEETVSVESVDQVCEGVLTTWLQRATPDELAHLRQDSPRIPGDIDRALLTDYSARTGIYYIDDAERYLLRERFWVKLAEAKP